MKISEIKTAIKSLTDSERDQLLLELSRTIEKSPLTQSGSRKEQLDNKQGDCPHCSSKGYVRFGKDKGSQRYKCKSCKRSFTEYTGTWLARLRRKDVVIDYLELMMQEKSLDKIVAELGINKKTAFDWRHKILAALRCEDQDDHDDFTGITESDETFFLHSRKGMNVKTRESRKRGGKSKSRGISKDQVAVIVTQDRKSTLDIKVSNMGRISKQDLISAIGNRIKSGQAILCSDSHHTYKGFARDAEIEFRPINVSKKQRVKGQFHIQNVNATHNKIKKWISAKFWGVSTKYLQQYMNWHMVKEQIKKQKNASAAMVEKLRNPNALNNYKNIQNNYDHLISTLE